MLPRLRMIRRPRRPLPRRRAGSRRSQVRDRPAARAAAGRALALLVAAAAAMAAPVRASEDPSRYRGEVDARRSFVVSTYGRVPNVRTHPKWYPYFVLARTKLRGCDPNLADYMAAVLDRGDPQASGLSEPELFSEPPLVRFLNRHGDCLTAAQSGRIARALERPQDLFGHGTINQAAIRTTSLYLLAQAFPDVVWTDRDGKRYRRSELQAQLKALMVRRYGRFSQTGEIEQLSPTYAAVSFFATLNLVEFSQDLDLKAYAEAYAVQLLTILRVSSLQGVILAPFHRQNAQQRSGPAQVGAPCISPTQHVLWLYFGEPEIGSRDLESGCEPTYVSMLADSDWIPPAVLASFPDPDSAPSEHRVTVPQFSLWDAPPGPFLFGTVYRSRNFAIGSGNAVLDPRGYNMADSTFLLAWRRPGAEFNSIACFHPYWTSNAGIEAWSTIRVPPAFAPNATSRSSPFQQAYFDRGRGVLLFSIPEADPWPGSSEPRFFAARDKQKDALFARQNCHFPKAVDEWGREGSWVFIRAGETYVGIEAVGLTPKLNDVADDPTVLGFVRMVTEARHAALFFVVEEASAHASFAAFKQHARGIARVHDPVQDSFEFAGQDGATNKVVFRLEPEPGSGRVRSIPRVTRDGRVIPIAGSRVIDGPTYRVGRGEIHLETRSGSLDIRAPLGAVPSLRQEMRAGAAQ
jgi:hypothetical protein